MTKARRWVELGTLALVFAGCGGTTAGVPEACTEATSALVGNGAEANGRLGFVVCPLEPTSGARSVPFFVGVRNQTPEPQVVRASWDLSGHLSVFVTGPDGSSLQPESEWEPVELPARVFPLVRYLLPRGGVIGRVIDLVCDGPEYSGEYEPDCAPLYRFSEMGTYTIDFHADRVYWCPAPCLPGADDEVDERLVEFPRLRLEVQVLR